MHAILMLNCLNRLRATTPESAVTDEFIAACLGGIPKRRIVDLSFELIEAGYVIVATCGKRPGRFLIPPGGDLEPARRYYESLRGRASRIFRRRRALRRAIERTAGQQLSLFEEAR